MKIFNWMNKKVQPRPLDTITVGNIPRGSGKLETSSLTWRFMSNYLVDQLESLRKKNDNPTLSVEKTNLIRGEIKMIKRILDLPNQVEE